MKIWTRNNRSRLQNLAFALLADGGSICDFECCAGLRKKGKFAASSSRFFNNCSHRDYGSVYDSLPSSTRSRTSRDRFISALKRSQDRYILDRINIGAVRVSGNIAVADTELYGRLAKPFEAEGKIVVQQYLVREDGKWRVATGDTATIQRFLKANPAFARKFPIRQPRIYVKQDGKWVRSMPSK